MCFCSKPVCGRLGQFYFHQLQDLNNEFRYQYSKLWLSILSVDRNGMRTHTGKLGIRGDLYPLFACMVTGRPWESVVAGVTKSTPTAAEKDLMQLNTTLVLPSISDILEQVDRQMLLVLKTNDLIRGIEYTLQTNNRMTSFWVMSKCCVRSVGLHDSQNAASQWERFITSLGQNWTLFKLNIYYLYLGVVHFSLLSTLQQLL